MLLSVFCLQMLLCSQHLSQSIRPKLQTPSYFTHTHPHPHTLFYLSTFQLPTSKAPSGLCPRCSSRYVPPAMQKKSQCASVNVCLCSHLFSVCFTVVHRHTSTVSPKRHISEPFPLQVTVPPVSLSFFLSLCCLFSFCLCNTLNPCSTNYS